MFRDNKGEFSEKCKFSHYLLTFMLTEGRLYFVRPQNSAGVSQENSVEESQTVSVNHDQFSNGIKNKTAKR